VAEEGSEGIESDWVVKGWGFGRDLVDAGSLTARMSHPIQKRSRDECRYSSDRVRRVVVGLPRGIVGVRCVVMSGAFKVVGGKSVVSSLVEKGGVGMDIEVWKVV
jgi:hypothetical protein